MSAAIGLVAGMGAATFTATVLALLAGRLAPWMCGVGFMAGAAATILVARQLRGTLSVERPGRWDLLVLAVFALVCLRQSFGLAYERGGEIATLVPNNYGDLPLHWTYVQNLANGASFWPENPIFTGQKLHYPLGADLLTSMLVQLGVSLPTALVALGLVCSALLGATLFLWGRGFAVAGFLFAGGLAGFEFVKTGVLRDAQQPLAWKSLYLALWIPQRGFLFALPAGLLLLWSFREDLIRGRRGLPPLVAGFLWGVMPLFHVHTFLFVSVLIAAWALATGRVRRALPSLGVAVGPACLLLWEVTERFRMGSVIWWKAGWVIGQENVLHFLALNFGFWLPLALAAAFAGIRTRNREGLLHLAPGLLIFAALFFVMFAPWDWDNTKLMLWCYLLLLPPVGALVLGWPVAARAVVMFGLMFSGAVSIAAACRGREAAAIANLDELHAVCGLLRGVPVDQRVATAQTFNHPVALCGHPLVAGYGGHLWSHGIQSKDVEEELQALMKGAPDWRDRARLLRAPLLFWGAREAAAFPASSAPWAAFPPVVRGPWGALYSTAAREDQGQGAQDQ